MNLTDLHRRLLADVLAVGGAYPLALTGGYAVQAHGLVNRLSQDLDVATENPDRMEDIASVVRTGLEQRGWHVKALETDPLSARLVVTDPASREECEVDILKEALWRPPVHTEHGLVLSLEDVVGTKVRALADRGLARDLIDVKAAMDHWNPVELEELGRRHARDSFDLSELQARLGGADWIDDTEFAAYGLDEQAITELRQWAQTWADDIGERLQELEIPQED
ncbi:nucleotidyl transferase AbiEii/AbiGii toxin family protein [Streptomyces sp. NBC_01387]|uniref:nucleotidyl transferase AbiEii/AbiGii toxin family protein n=1 Tax=unclassified Streptomyces TaxID=2593676 RepID=UPI0020240296|nr:MULTISPECIES: nucleotidyl transferase AbiEii/AbiGii toxin family protein [unclassified Streptomyces]MCX4549788.1 nucleotidyl transferase AbiEii/AbiGii toxin family protein [Streptomyces sp. NBC_01500]WSV55249.1 nucleotidyl transferase AbiEii/AbiGii toxin family protein [Streptomyces sp. NBC_01014]